MSNVEVDGEDVYRAVLRLAYRDGSVEGEEMDWLRRSAELLEIGKKDRQRIQGDVRHQSRMGQLPEDEAEPTDIYRRFCVKAWRNDQIGSAEVEALEDLARAFGFDRALAEGILAGTASPGATVPDLVDIEGEGRPDSPPPGVAAPTTGSKSSKAEAASDATPAADGPGFPVVEVLVVAAVVAGVAAMVVL